MTARNKPTNEPTTGDAQGTVPGAADTVQAAGDAGPDLANVDTSAYAGVEGATGTVVDGTADLVDDEPIAQFKALGNANADVNITAVRTGHGTWYWTARDAADGSELAKGGPHYEATLVENLTKLFGGQSTIALHRTGDTKARRLA